MICTEQERAALKRILAVLKPILTDHNPPIAIDWVGKGAIAVGQEFELAINAVREHKDDAAIRAMLAPDDAVVRELIAKAIARPRNHRFTINQGEPTLFDYERADAVLSVLRGEETR